MIEKIVLDYLKNGLSIPVYMEEPIKKPHRYLLIEKTGSTRENYIDSATLAIQSYESSLFKASELNEEVKKLMYKITELNSVSRCELNSDYNFTDTETKRYRYQAVFNLVYFDE